VAVRGLGGGDEFVLGGVEFAVEDVLAHRAVEQERFLAHDADVRAQRFERRVLMSCPSMVMRPPVAS
jgi:hypothetical protein